MKYLLKVSVVLTTIIFFTAIAVWPVSAAAVTKPLSPMPPAPCSPQSTSLVDQTAAAAAINAATQALQATNATSQLAINAGKEAMEKTKVYYEEMTTKLLWAAAVFAFIVGAGGITAIELSNQRRIRRLTRKAVTNFQQIFDPKMKDFNNHMQDSRQFRANIEKNLQGFILLTPAFDQLTGWCYNYGHLEASQRPDAKTIANRSLRTCDDVLALNPTDRYLLGLTHSMKGVALNLDGRLQTAYDAFMESLNFVPDRASPLYNAACTACQLTKYAEAKQHLRVAIRLEPSRAEQAREDADFEPLLNDQEFRAIVGLPWPPTAIARP
jgi:tetratricopeptide (TPR) repeat protein